LLEVYFCLGDYGNSTERFTEVTTATDKWDFEIVFGDMMDFIGWSQHLAFVDIINSDSLKDLKSA
jgi:hypothetical protein